MKKIVCTISIILFMLVTAGTVLGITGKTNTSDLNLRDGASLSSNVLMKINKNETLNIIEEDGDWYKVSYKNYTGYVSKQYINKDEETNQTPVENNNQVQDGNAKISSAATVYVLPLLNSTKMGTLPKDEVVTVISEIENWKYVQTNKFIGWILDSKVENSSNQNGNNENNTSNENQVANEVSNVENKIENEVADNNSTNNNGNSSNNNNSISTNNSSNSSNNTNSVSDNNSNSNTNSSSSSSNTSYPTTMYVNVDAVNIREDATTSSDVVASVGRNNPVRVTGESGDWYKVEVSDGKGYIMKKYLSKTEN